MIAYIDSSVLLRLVLRRRDYLRQIGVIEKPVSSKLLRVDCHRLLDSLWHSGELDDRALQKARREIESFMDVVEVWEIHDHILELATQPFEEPLSSSAALHLATAMFHLIPRASGNLKIVFATHDDTLATVARNHFPIIGT